MKERTVAVIFGGAGFIGQHFSRYLLEENIVSKVIMADIAPNKSYESFSKFIDEDNPKITIETVDVRHPINLVEENIKLIANFAAIHREPGHCINEYYETNILGAENICSWAEKINCSNIVFTSSISTYGPTESEKDELSLTAPETAYGNSKLLAEKIHQIWQARDQNRRRLVIVRPGVVFGPGENGNVSRLIKAVLGRYFFYTGNKNTRKAGIYVKELCHAIWWVMKYQLATDKKISLFNMSTNPCPTLKNYVDSICEVAGVNRRVISVPYVLLYFTACLIEPVSNILRITQPINRVRIKKLVHSNNIIPRYLEKTGYKYRFTFLEALKDWKRESPHEW